MQIFLERLLSFWAAITTIGLVLVILVWAISTIIYVAFISLFLVVLVWAISTIIYVAFISIFIAIAITAFYHFYWVNRDI